VMDMTDDGSGAAGDQGGPVDLSAFLLPVLAASESELVDHERVLGEIDKASGGKTIWRAQQQEAVA
jgi:DNA polymerase III subunit epsilon